MIGRFRYAAPEHIELQSEETEAPSNGRSFREVRELRLGILSLTRRLLSTLKRNAYLCRAGIKTAPNFNEFPPIRLSKRLRNNGPAMSALGH
jgi:hypothetical protein